MYPELQDNKTGAVIVPCCMAFAKHRVPAVGRLKTASCTAGPRRDDIQGLSAYGAYRQRGSTSIGSTDRQCLLLSVPQRSMRDNLIRKRLSLSTRCQIDLLGSGMMKPSY
jgi:hypothetical protein